MTEQKNSSKKIFTLDWLMRGALTRIGDTFDRLTGRRWNPSSSLATSELTERLKMLLDAEARDLGEKGKFVPHNIKLKMQWDKFSTDAAEALKKLEHELLVAAVDHINDNRYHTYAPMKIEIKPDYFTQGVKLMASFDKFVEEEREAAINVTVPQIENVGNFIPEPPPAENLPAAAEVFRAVYATGGKGRQTEHKYEEKQRRSVGRTKENDLSLEDPSVSKIHAALVLGGEKQLMVADTGSTNGTFINDQRIAYGRAFAVNAGDRVKFGNVEVTFERVPAGAEIENATAAAGASQRDIQTVAFDSREHLGHRPATTGNGAAAGQHAPPATAAEADKAANGTSDRVVFDFSRDDQ